MARAREQKGLWPRQMIHQPPDAGERRDMILAPGLDIGGGADLLEIDRRSHRRQAVRDHETIVAVEIDQILPVPFRGQVGDVAVPIKEVGGRIGVTQPIIIQEERSGGQEGVITWQSPGLPYHEKKKNKENEPSNN